MAMTTDSSPQTGQHWGTSCFVFVLHLLCCTVLPRVQIKNAVALLSRIIQLCMQPSIFFSLSLKIITKSHLISHAELWTMAAFCPRYSWLNECRYPHYAAAEQSVVCHIPAPTTRHVLTVNIFVCFPDICIWNHIIWPETYHGNEQSRIILLKSVLDIILTYHCTNGIGILLQTSASCIIIIYLISE